MEIASPGLWGPLPAGEVLVGDGFDGRLAFPLGTRDLFFLEFIQYPRWMSLKSILALLSCAATSRGLK